MDKVERRLELLKLEGLGFSRAEIVKEFCHKMGCSGRNVNRDFESQAVGQHFPQSAVKPHETLLQVVNRYEQIYYGSVVRAFFKMFSWLVDRGNRTSSISPFIYLRRTKRGSF